MGPVQGLDLERFFKKRHYVKLVMPELPTPATISIWRTNLVTNLAAASGINDGSVLGWASEAWGKDSTFESLSTEHCPPKFRDLDAELGQAANTQVERPGVPSELKRRIQKAAGDSQKKGSIMAGRQYLWMIGDYNRTEGGFQKAYTVANLLTVQWLGDEKIDLFLDQWDRVLDNFLPEQLAMIQARNGKDPSVLQDLFGQQFEKAKEPHLVYLQSEYKSAKQNGDPVKFSYEFLRRSLDNHVNDKQLRKQQDYERKELELLAKGKGAGHGGLSLAPAQEGGKNGRKGKTDREPTPMADRKKNGACWFHAALKHAGHTEGCRLGKLCFKHHDPISKEDFDKLPKLGKGRGRTNSPDRNAGKGGKGGDRANSKPPTIKPNQSDVCKSWRATGTCSEWAACECFKLHPKAWANIGEEAYRAKREKEKSK